MFSDFEHFGDAVPVAASAGGIEGFIDERPGEFGLADTMGEIDVEFAAAGVELFAAGIDFHEAIAGRLTGVASKEGDQEFAGLDAMATGEGISGNDMA